MTDFYSNPLYKNLPVLSQNAFVTAKGLLYTKLKRGRRFHDFQNELLTNEKLNRKEIYDLQFSRWPGIRGGFYWSEASSGEDGAA